MSWKKTLEPYASIWREFVEQAAGRGLMHGQWVHDRLSACVGNYGPADAADLIAAIVDAGELRPIKKDLAGCSHSIKAFRGIGPSAGGRGSDEWNSAEAHLWTYEVPR